MAIIPSVRPGVERKVVGSNYRQQLNAPDLSGVADGLVNAGQAAQKIGQIGTAYYLDRETEAAHKAWGQAHAGVLSVESELRGLQGTAVTEMPQATGPDGSPIASPEPAYLDQARKKLREVYDANTKGLSGLAKRKFDEQWGPTEALKMAAFERHYADEHKKVVVARADVQAEQYEKDLVANASDPAAVRHNKFGIISQESLRGRTLGLPEEAVRASIDKRLTSAHSNAVSKFLSEDRVDEASAYFEANKGEIDPRVHDSILNKLQGQGDLVAAQNAVKVMDNRPEALGDNLAWIDANLKGNRAEIARRMAKERAGDFVQADNARQVGLYRETQKALFDAANAGMPNELLEFLGQKLSMNLRGDHAEAVMKDLDGIKKSRDYVDPDASTAALITLQVKYDMGLIPDEATMLSDLARSQMTKADQNAFRTYFRNNGNDPLKGAEVDAILRRMTGKSALEQPKGIMLGLRPVMDALRREYPGRTPPKEEVEKQIAMVLSSGEIMETGGWTNPNTKGYAAQAQKKDSTWLPDVSSGESDMLQMELEALGVDKKQASDEEVQRVYKKSQARWALSPAQQRIKSLWDKGPKAPQITAADVAKGTLSPVDWAARLYGQPAPSPSLTQPQKAVTAEADALLGK